MSELTLEKSSPDIELFQLRLFLLSIDSLYCTSHT